VDRFVQGTKQEGSELDRVGREGHFGGFQEQLCGGLLHEFHACKVDSFQHSKHRFSIWMGARILNGTGPSRITFSKPAWHQIDIAFGSPPLAEEHQPILSYGQMADLPSKMAWNALRWGLPKFLGDLGNQA
jgi:hypothetical protein